MAALSRPRPQPAPPPSGRGGPGSEEQQEGGLGRPGEAGSRAVQPARPAPPRRRAAFSRRGLAPPSRPDRAVGGDRGVACGRLGESGRGGRQKPRRSGGRSRRRTGVGPRAAIPRGRDQLPQGALRPGVAVLPACCGVTLGPEPRWAQAGRARGGQSGSARSPGRLAGL